VLLQHFADIGAPIIEPAAEIGRRQMPEQPVAAMQVDPMDAVAARQQRAAEPVEKVGDPPAGKGTSVARPSLLRPCLR